MSHEKERAEFEAWYASAIWGNEDYKQSLFRAWREGREDLIRKLATVSVEWPESASSSHEVYLREQIEPMLAAARVQAAPPPQTPFDTCPTCEALARTVMMDQTGAA